MRKVNENNRQYAYRVLYGCIMSLAFEPGMTLVDAELSPWLQISRTPIREAIMRLLESRLVEVYPQRSSCVSRINLDYVEEGIFLRHVAETAIINEATQKASASDISRLRENLAQQKQMLDDGDIPSFVELDNNFHRLLYLAAGKPWTWDTINSISTHLNRVRLLLQRAGKSTFLAGYEEHCQLFDSIVTRNTDGISQFLYEHLTAGYRTTLPYLMAQYPEYFSS